MDNTKAVDGNHAHRIFWELEPITAANVAKKVVERWTQKDEPLPGIIHVRMPLGPGMKWVGPEDGYPRPPGDTDVRVTVRFDFHACADGMYRPMNFRVQKE